MDSPEKPKSFTSETLKTVKINSESVVFKVEKMAENIAKIDEKIRELKRKKREVENGERIKDQRDSVKAINQILKGSGKKITKIEDIVSFLQAQETSGNWLSKWLTKNLPEK